MHNRILRVEERNPRPRVFQPIQNESTKAAADIGKCPGGGFGVSAFSRAERRLIILFLLTLGVYSAPGSGNAQAAICFLPDCMEKLADFGGGNISSQYCKDMGYIYYGSGQCPEYHAQDSCPHDSHYLKCDAAQWCRDNGYETKVEDCTVPEYADEKCPNGQEVYKRCKADYEQACTEEDPDYVSECQEGWILDENELCSYSEMYGKCCNLCSDYPYEEDEIPEGYVKGESCNACGNVTRYKIEPNPCIGYQKCTDTPKSGTPECKHGNETWYKECCAYECSLAECPEGTDCNFEVCSSKYCIVGCLVDYTDYCQKPVTDCAALGYTSTSCGGRKLVCPYDSGLFFCM